GNGQVLRASGLAKRRTEADTVDAGAAIAVIRCPRDVAIEHAVAIHVGGVVAGDLREIHGTQDVAFGTTDADAANLVNIQDSNIEGFVCLVFARAVDLVGVRVEVQVSQMAGPANKGADQVAMDVESGQQIGKGVIDIAAGHIHSNTLY